MIIRVILDTNIFISGIFWEGNYCSQIIDAWQTGKIMLVSSFEMVQEFLETIRDFKIEMPEEMIQEWEHMIIENAIMVTPTEKLDIVKNDPKDNKFFEAAVAGKADYIVSQDKKHVLSVHNFRGIKTIHPGEFVKIIEQPMTKRVFIVHGWDFNPKMNWYPWLKNELEKKGFKTIVPEMPNTSEPEITAWLSYLKKVVGRLDENTYFVGHSIGCQAIMRLLEKEEYKGKIGKVIFVAGWFKLDNLENKEVEEIARPWIETPIEFNKVKEKLNELTVFLSSDEPYGFVEYNEKIFREKLNAKIIIEENKGHFTEDDNVKEVPEVLKEIIS